MNFICELSNIFTVTQVQIQFDLSLWCIYKMFSSFYICAAPLYHISRGEKRMIPTACLSRVKQYKAAKDRYFHLAASSIPLPFVLPVVPSLFSSSFYPPVGIRGPPSEGCKECPIPPACRAQSSRGLLRTGTFISLRLLSHFLSCFLSSLPFPLHLLTYFFPH